MLVVVELRSPRPQGPPVIRSSGRSLWPNSVGQKSLGQLRRSGNDGRSQVAIVTSSQPDKIAALREAAPLLRRLTSPSVARYRDRLLLCQMRGSANALSSSTLQLAQLRRSALPSLSTIPFRYDDRCRNHLLRQRSYNQLTVNDDVSDEVTSSINSVTGRGPEGTADGVAIVNPLPDWMADGQEGRRTAVSVVATRVRKGSEKGPKTGDFCPTGVPRGTRKNRKIPEIPESGKPPGTPPENGPVRTGL